MKLFAAKYHERPGNIEKAMTSNGKQFTLTREMLTAVPSHRDSLILLLLSLSSAITLPATRSSVKRHLNEHRKVSITRKLALYLNRVSLIFDSDKFRAKLRLIEGDANGFVTALYYNSCIFEFAPPPRLRPK